MLKRILYLIFVFAFALTVTPVLAQDDDSEDGDDGETLTVITYDSFTVSDEVRSAFEEETGITLEIRRLGDAGAMLNELILTKDNPLGDVVYGVDNTFLSRALGNELFVPYESPGLENVPEAFQLDQEENRVTPVTYGDVCLNYDAAYFEENDVPVPETLRDLAQPEYEGKLVVENPATSSPGLAFLLSTIAVFGEEGDYTYLDYWEDLRQNETLVVPGWTEAYYGEFSGGSSEGTYPLVVSYASSPPVEVLYAEDESVTADNPPTGAITADETCFRQIEFAGILQGTEHEAAAQQFIDFLLGKTFQEGLPLSMFVFPVNSEADLPEIFQEMVVLPEEPLSVPYEDIEANREDWIDAWNDVMLR